MNINEFEAKKILQSEGITVTSGSIAQTANDARRIAEQIGYPVVLKIVSEDIVHKSDVGGVILGITKDNIKGEFIKMIHHTQEKLPQARIQGIYVQKMSKLGIEVIIGIKNDAQFGRVVMFGMGGVYAEVMNDTTVRILPITEDDARQMINETKIGKVLMGARGKVYDIQAVIDTIIKVSLLSDKYNVKELDINPLMVYDVGVCAVDARINI